MNDVNGHVPECRNAAGSCCPWMGDCTCQCLCDVLRVCEDRVRTELLASESRNVFSPAIFEKAYGAAAEHAARAAGTVVSEVPPLYHEGFLDGLIAAGWECGDCGNRYGVDIDVCPNGAIDQAFANLRAAQRRSADELTRFGEDAGLL